MRKRLRRLDHRRGQFDAGHQLGEQAAHPSTYLTPGT